MCEIKKKRQIGGRRERAPDAQRCEAKLSQTESLSWGGGLSHRQATAVAKKEKRRKGGELTGVDGGFGKTLVCFQLLFWQSSVRFYELLPNITLAYIKFFFLSLNI